MNQQRKIELHILAMHRVLAARIRAGDLSPIAKACNNLQRWKLQFGGELPGAYRVWQQLLEQPPEQWLHLLEADTEDATRWRSSAPFAGAINPQERWRILRDASRAA
jgi:hypothetical protein